jgi:iron-sulfur cluster repair protein YtfE (RIC family)
MNLIQIQTNAMQTTVDPHALVTTTPIMELIAQHPELQPILDGLGLDTCCAGHLTVTEACRADEVDVVGVTKALLEVLEARNTA